MATITLETQLVTHDCGECGGTYAINARYDRQKKENGGTWNCPYCQVSWGYIKSQVDKLKEQLQKKEEQVQRERQKHDQTKAELRETEQRRSAQKGVTTRIKNRIAAGTCPCCGKPFADLMRHMKNQHPDFEKTDDVIPENLPVLQPSEAKAE